MASTYSDLKIELIGTGEQVGTWGSTTNVNLGTAIEEAITGSATVTFSSADETLTLSNTNGTQTARNLRLVCTGTSGGARNLILGSGCQIEKLYLIQNDLADAVTVKNTTGTGVTIPAGRKQFVFNDGSNVVEATSSVIDLTTDVTGTLPVANGGTGITSFGTGVATFLGTPSSANLAAAVTDETGSGALVFATSPTLVSPILGTPQSGTVTNLTGTASININGTVGATTPSTGAFTTLTTSSTATFGGNTAITGTLSATGDGTFSGTGQVKLPAGTTAERSGSPADGMLRYNTDLDSFEGYVDGVWGGINGVPVGTVIYYAANAAPTGYLKANGANVSRTTYAALFAVIGTVFGVGDGSTTFALPDLRGEFLRGWDDGRDVDSGRVFGTEQNPTAIAGFTGNNGSIGVINSDGTSPVNIQFTATNITGTVATFYRNTRPRNIALLACIKF